MKLFIQDEQGQYVTATTPEIIKEGRSRIRSTLKRGTEFIGSTQAAKEAIASKIFSYQHEVFGCLFLDTKNCILQGGEKLIATVGVKNLIVVDTPDAILICQKENAEDIKKVLENLRICDRTDYI